MPETAPVPTPDRKPAWRAAAVAYREQRRAGATHHASWLAAVEALQAVWPLPIEDAKRETTHAIAYASMHHTKWFWNGV
jgi:hypothetical protein